MPFTVSDVQAFAELNRDDHLERIRATPDIAALHAIVPDKIERAFASGEWLHAELVKMGCDEERANDICFAMGQRAVFGEPFLLAVRYANEYETERAFADKPGAELARQLCEEHLGIPRDA